MLTTDFPTECRFHIHFAKCILDHADFTGHIIKCRELHGLQQRFSNCGPRTTSGPRVLPLWSF